ncbi:MAG: hypothetical protein ACREVE_08490 [Gammaproteobacteria bacterium]
MMLKAHWVYNPVVWRLSRLGLYWLQILVPTLPTNPEGLQQVCGAVFSELIRRLVRVQPLVTSVILVKATRWAVTRFGSQ